MYTGTNPTALRSQSVIADATIELMKKKAFEKISVKEICRAADLSRQTFYGFFSSREAVIRYCIKQRLLNIPKQIDVLDRNRIDGYFRTYIAGNKPFLNLLDKNRLGSQLAEELSDSLNEMEENLDPGGDKNSRRIANAFLSSALVSSFLVWADEEVKMSDQEFIDLIYQIIRGRYFKIE